MEKRKQIKLTILGGGKSQVTFDKLISLPDCATATNFRATNMPALSKHPLLPGSDKSHTRDKTTSLNPDFLRKRAASMAPTVPTPFGSTLKKKFF